MEKVDRLKITCDDGGRANEITGGTGCWVGGGITSDKTG